MDSTRMEAFSDGVFAVAITLLVLDLTVKGPGTPAGTLAHQLRHDWPQFAAYVVSFFTIGIVWVNHHVLLRGVAQVDRTLLFINLTLLLFVVVIPFSTSTVALYLHHNNADAHLAVALYTVVLEGMSAGFSAVFWWSVRDERRRHVPIPPGAVRSATIRFGLGGAVYALALVVAFINADAALAIIAAVAVYYIFEQTPAAQADAGGPADSRGDERRS
jgi:uncharacterized membrane protein